MSRQRVWTIRKQSLTAKQGIHSLIGSKSHSISKTMLARYPMPPASDGLATTFRTGIRLVIAERNSFATVQELQRRERRISSLLDNGGFFLTDADSPLRLNRPALQKMKDGLAHAMRLTDRLADTDGCKEIIEKLGLPVPKYKDDLAKSWRMLYKVNRSTGSPIPGTDLLRTCMFLAYNKQEAIIEELPTRDLAWLVTLADGAAMGFKRYTMGKYKDANNRAVANMAFQEMILRDGSSVLWAFVRGDRNDCGYIEERLIQCGCEIIWWEDGGSVARTASGAKFLPDGLHMTIMQELRRRFIREAIEERERLQAEKAGQENDDDSEDGNSDFDPEDFRAVDAWSRVNEIIKKEIGAEQWLGYMNVEWPHEDTVDNAFPTSDH